LLGSAGCFLALALAVMLVDPFPGDAATRLWLLGYGSPGVVQVMRRSTTSATGGCSCPGQF